MCQGTKRRRSFALRICDVWGQLGLSCGGFGHQSHVWGASGRVLTWVLGFWVFLRLVVVHVLDVRNGGSELL